MLERRWQGRVLLAENLGLHRWSGTMRVSLAELQAINRGFPLRSVFGDGEWWATKLDCDDCGEFLWRLPLRFRASGGLRFQWSMELARFMAARTQDAMEECPACTEEIVESDPSATRCWFSVKQQEWCLQVPLLPGEAIVLPLGLPSWAPARRVQEAADRLLLRRGEEPFDWQKEM